MGIQLEKSRLKGKVMSQKRQIGTFRVLDEFTSEKKKKQLGSTQDISTSAHATYTTSNGEISHFDGIPSLRGLIYSGEGGMWGLLSICSFRKSENA